MSEGLRKVIGILEEATGRGISDDEAGTIFEKHLKLQDEIKFGPNKELVVPDPKDPDNPAKFKVNLELFPKKLQAEVQRDTEELNSRLEEVRSKYGKTEGDKRISEIVGIMVPTTIAREREKISYTPPEALEYIYKNRKTFERMNDIYEELSKLQKEGKLTPEIVNERMKEISQTLRPRMGEWSQEEIALAASLLTPLERNFFGKAGSLSEGGGLFRAGDELPSSYGDLSAATDEQQRARVLLGARIILESNGKNIYTGQPLNVLESDWEHMISFEAIRRNAEVYHNIGLVSSRDNGGKADKPPSWLYNTGKGGYMSGMKFDDNGKLTPESRAKWEAKERAKVEVKELKRKGFELSYYQRGQERVQALQELVAMVQNSKLRSKDKLDVLNKVALGMLLEGDPKFAATAGGGIQSHGRAGKRWYYFGYDNPEFCRFVSNKLLELAAKGDSEGIKKVGEIMEAEVNEKLNPTIKEQLGTNYTYKGKPSFKLGDEGTEQVREIMEKLSKQAMERIKQEIG